MAKQNSVPDYKPIWKHGLAWRVEYSLTVPSSKMGPVTQLPPPHRSIWRYEIVVCDERAAHMIASEEGGSRRYKLVFDVSDSSLRSISTLDDTDDDFDPVKPSDAYFGWTQSLPVVFDWPYFPKMTEPAGYKFSTSMDDEVTQLASIDKDGQVKIVLTNIDSEDKETIRSTQVWTPGEPWWDEISVEFEFADKKPSETFLAIQGKRLQ